MFGSGELILILLAGFLLFGGKKLPELARGLGRGLREFKLALQGEEDLSSDVEILNPSQSKNSDENKTEGS